MNKNHKNTIIYLAAMVVALLLGACSDDMFEEGGQQHGNDRIQLSGDIDQLAVTRVNDNGFCNGDVMGVYIVDYDGGTPGTLKASGNRGDNVRHTFDEPNYRWNSAYDLYWKDKHTHIDVYGYYPFADPESVDDYQFEVKRDQSKPSENGEMGGYEASDFLWGKVADVAPTTSVIRLPMKHRMSNACVTLVEGSGFADGEWASTDKVVLTANVARKASINMADGTVKTAGSAENTMTIPSRTGDEWRTIVVPQTVQAGTTLFSITIGGVPYKFAKNENLEYVAGKMMKFGIRVDKKAGSGQYQLTLISESITPWENDLVSHDATAKEYVVVNCPTAGGLKDAIAAAKLDYTKIPNLKITGEINYIDFNFMREQMSSLEALNLKEVKITKYDKYFEEDAIPDGALSRTKLNYLVFPDRLKVVGYGAFSNCTYLVGSLIIPEGVSEIRREAFQNCTGLDGTLTLPSTLKTIGYYAFDHCSSLTGNLYLPEGLETIGDFAFENCKGFYGELHLPESLKEIRRGAFRYCRGFTGDLSIPQKLNEISEMVFEDCRFNGHLNLYDGITGIGESAFLNCSFRGELVLPNNLKTIGKSAFYSNYFSGTLHLPSSLLTIGEQAFAGNSMTGILEIPEKITNINNQAFLGCGFIEGLVFPANIETIGNGAFSGCYGIGSIVCKGAYPAYVKSGAFDGVPKDNFTVEVPESAVAQYQAAVGWNEFKRIAAHHELVCRPSIACALATEHKKSLIVDAEGEWEVASKPDWCEVSPASGNKKTEVTLTINAMAKNGSSREGKVVFRLKDEDYTHECRVSQYGYEYGEDQWLTLQKATKGKNGGINIVLLGDGYDAKSIADGSYLKTMKQEMEYFFGLEPYTTYRDYFNVYTAFPLSTESGVGTVNTIRYNRFNTTFTGGVAMKADYDEIFAYALNAPTVTKANLNQTLIIMVPNTTEYGGMTQMWTSGAAIAFCPLSIYDYPFDSRGVLQHEAGGHGFGKLGDEYIYFNTFIPDIIAQGVIDAKSIGWYDNISITGKMHNVTWSHLIFDPRYSDLVDIYEGGYKYSRGVFRSEQNSCMNNNIPYYSTISRESIVKRIKRYAGETYSFEDFVKNDKREAGNVTRSTGRSGSVGNVNSGMHQHAPVIHRGNPLNMSKVRKHR